LPYRWQCGYVTIKAKELSHIYLVDYNYFLKGVSVERHRGVEMEFEGFFEATTGFQPFPYQIEIATTEDLPGLVNIPTGLGKTEAVIGAWLWRRKLTQDQTIPARLVYCLPMRVLVEQTAGRVRNFVDKAGFGSEVGVFVLMGGEAEEDWMLYPEKDCVIVGTQDMLLSRALNRGYAMSRFGWPRAYGLLNNDCLWVFDEVQLMGNAVATSAQLQAFRDMLGTFAGCRTMWMSATLERRWLETVDFASSAGSLTGFELTKADLSNEMIWQRINAVKILECFNANADQKRYLKQLAEMVLEEHRSSEQTLVIVNTVDRAVRLFQELENLLSKKVKAANIERGGDSPPEILLLHSRFRRKEKKEKELALHRGEPPEGGRIIISTQVVEAGVDISSSLLITEAAPWSSMVQRFGRCNRYGEDERASVIWIDIPSKLSPPYEEEDIDKSREMLRSLEGRSVAPDTIRQLSFQDQRQFKFVIRKRDFLDLFNNTPDLSGNDIDISRFIREDDANDVFAFWRDFEEKPNDDMAKPEKEELCPVPVSAFKDWLKDSGEAFEWDYIEKRWLRVKPNSIRPGSYYLIRAETGGYSLDRGWSPDSKVRVDTLVSDGAEAPESSQDDAGAIGSWVTLPEHSAHVRDEMKLILDGLGNANVVNECKDLMLLASFLHDLGKASKTFQEALLRGIDGIPGDDNGELWAKRKERGRLVYSPRYFRHELMSAMFLLARRADFASMTDDRFSLLLYLVACHHGKVRLSIRSMPDEEAEAGGGRIALGVRDGDEIGPVDLGDGITFPRTAVTLDCIEMGRASNGETSWLERMLRLLKDEKLGPLRLAYLEALIRAADVRASIAEKGNKE
jgi:CRISPR-associated endonuclease/helicase Cas3